MDDPALKLLLLLALILLNAFFAMSEIAVISLNEQKVKKLAECGNKKAIKLQKLLDDMSGFLSTIQIGVTLAGFLASALAASNFAEPLAGLVAPVFGLSQPNGTLLSVSTVIVTVIISFFSLVLGELVPKSIAIKKSEKVAFGSVGLLLFFKSVMKPFVKVLTFSTNLIVRLFGIDPKQGDDEVTEEEIRLMVDAGEESGAIEESQKEMINNIFEFDDAPVSDVMTVRADMVVLEKQDSIDEAVKLATKEGFSRIPVYEDELDNIVGILYIKDLLPYIGKPIPESKKLSRIMREAVFVPESKKCADLFEEMTENHNHMVIVSDEYGSVTGLVTIEDLLETIVGNIQDEYDTEEEETVKRSDGTVEIDGSADIEELSQELHIDFPQGEYDTIGGFIMSELGRIPNKDEKPEIQFGGYLFTVTEIDDRRIEHVVAKKLP